MSSPEPKASDASGDLREIPSAVIAQAEAAASNDAEAEPPIDSGSRIHNADPKSSHNLSPQGYVQSEAYHLRVAY